MRVAAIIAAAGVGERFGRQGGKQLAPLSGSTVLEHSLRPFVETPLVGTIVVVVHERDVLEVETRVSGTAKISAVLAGGATRQESVARGISAVPGDADVILVHDGARPLVSRETVERAIRALTPDVDGVVVGYRSFDTVKVVGATGLVERTEDRSRLWLIQTPQVFWARALRAAFASAGESGFVGTDDAAVVEHNGGRVRVVEGPRDNIKVTVSEDLVVAEALLRLRSGGMTQEG